MRYFDSLPNVVVTNSNNQSYVLKNLLVRTQLIPQLAKNPLIFYKYSIQDGDTPEIIAHKYYNDMYRYWIILFANEILDPQWNWPLNTNQFNDFLSSKYPSTNIYTTVHHYEKTITQFDISTQTTTVNTVEITQSDYNSFMPVNSTFTLPTGPVNYTTSASVVNIYDYEVAQNEAKRTINILNSQYIDQFEQEFKKLLS